MLDFLKISETFEKNSKNEFYGAFVKVLGPIANMFGLRKLLRYVYIEF